ncbi:MAG: hypothetical protein RPS47_13820 [Colwellia sp.]|jgi:hypothetical protein
MSKVNTEFESIQSQIDDLKLKQVNMMKKAKEDTEKQIYSILEKSGFSLFEIFPDSVKKQADPDNIVVINKIEYVFKKRISKGIREALTGLNLDADSYDAEKLIAEFGA